MGGNRTRESFLIYIKIYILIYGMIYNMIIWIDMIYEI